MFDDDHLFEYHENVCGGWSIMIMMSIVTEKPLSWELSWHLIEEAWRSQINFDCTVWGGWGSHVGVLAGYQCGYLMKLEPSLCTNGQTKVMVMVAAVVAAVVVGVINSPPPPCFSGGSVGDAGSLEASLVNCGSVILLALLFSISQK